MQFCMDNSGKTAISWHASGRMSSTVITGLDQGPILFHSDCCLARTAMLDSNILMQQESSFLNCKQNSRHLKLSQNCCLFFPQYLEAMQETDLVWHQQEICHRQFVKLLMSWQNQVNDMCPQSWWQFWHQDHFPWSIPLEMTSWNFLLVTAWAQQCNFLKTHEVACQTKTQEHLCLPHSVALQHAGSMASPTKIWAHQLCENEQRSDAVPLRAINIHVVQFIHSSDCFPLICAASNMHRTDLIDRWVLQSQLLVSQSPRKSSLSSCACRWARKKWKFTCRTPLFIIKKSRPNFLLMMHCLFWCEFLCHLRWMLHKLHRNPVVSSNFNLCQSCLVHAMEKTKPSHSVFVGHCHLADSSVSTLSTPQANQHHVV